MVLRGLLRGHNEGNSMNGRNRRRKDVPFNPFAPNAVAERNRRQAERAKEKRRQDAQNVAGTASTTANDNSSNKSLEELRKKAQQKLGVEEPKTIVESVVQEKVVEPVKTTPVKEAVVKQPKPIEIPESKEEKVGEIVPAIIQNSEEDLLPKTKKPSREERLAELKRKSQQSKDNAKARKTTPQTEIVDDSNELFNDTDVILETEFGNERINSNSSSTIEEKNINVFKTIQSVDKKSAGISKKKRKSRRMDKKGGGRQRMEKKIKKEKILEFKYAAREILDNPDVPEEHRSNILGQIIAKGERISVEAALEFIEQKNLELILTDEISDKLKSEIKSITTRR
tara:strand:+ start:411 stop:1433 length:1023 start_codon:yes stop_codon:yes gene_type:complete